MPAPAFAWTSRADGDIAADLAGLPARTIADAPRPWTWLRQVHGPRVVLVDRPGGSAGVEADGAVTATPGCALAVRTADCGPLVLQGERAVGVVHAGWRGLLAGVVANAVGAMADLDGGRVIAHLGPCIRPGCYEFAGPERVAVAERFGGDVLATTTWGTPALDLPAAITTALAEAGVTRLRDEAPCTACDRRWFSHRGRTESGRFATVAWIPA